MRMAMNDIPLNGTVKAEAVVDGQPTSIIITRRGDRVSAFINRCPHARWPLDTFDGRFLLTDDQHLICAAHTAVFHAVTGQALGGPGRGEPLVKLETQVQDNVLLISERL
jgi:nitrite reductase/ring-hydroxylating ferredoxin subunit